MYPEPDFWMDENGEIVSAQAIADALIRAGRRVTAYAQVPYTPESHDKPHVPLTPDNDFT